MHISNESIHSDEDKSEEISSHEPDEVEESIDGKNPGVLLSRAQFSFD